MRYDIAEEGDDGRRRCQPSAAISPDASVALYWGAGRSVGRPKGRGSVRSLLLVNVTAAPDRTECSANR